MEASVIWSFLARSRIATIRLANMHHQSPRKITCHVSPPPPLSRTDQSSETANPGSANTLSRTQSGPGWHGFRPQTTPATKVSDKQKRPPALTYAKNLPLADLQRVDGLRPLSSFIDSRLQQQKSTDSYSSPYSDSTQTTSSCLMRQDQKHRSTVRPATVLENRNQIAASSLGLGRFGPEPQFLCAPSLAGVSSESSRDARSSKSSTVNRKMQNNLNIPTTSGSKFYASVIKSAVEKVQNERRQKKSEDAVFHELSRKERKKASERRKQDQFPSRTISNFEQSEPPPYEMHIIVALALFPIALLIACLLIANSMCRDEYNCDLHTTPMIITSTCGFSSELFEFTEEADIIKNFGWIAVWLQMIVLPYIFPTAFSLILKGFQASDKYQKMSVCVCVCVCACVHTWNSHV